MTFRWGLPVCAAASFALAAPLPGCGEGGPGVVPILCPPLETGTGRLSIVIQGTPGGVGLVTVDGQMVTSDTDFTLRPGQYDVVAQKIAPPTKETVRTVYTASISPSGVCLRDGATETITVTYSAVPTSGELWVGNSLTTAALLGFTAASVVADGAPSASVAINTVGADGFTFDREGNVWVLGATPEDPPIARYPASQLETSHDAIPDIIITSPSFGTTPPGPKVLAFDPLGNLWVSIEGENKLVRLQPWQIAASGNPVSSVQAGGIAAPSGIAFDFEGNLWVASKGTATINRLDASHVNSNNFGADFKISATTGGEIDVPLPSPLGLAFDAAGNLWVNYSGTIAKLTPADLAGVGETTVVPSVQITADVSTLSYGIAFDEQGGLWVAYSAGQFARFAPGQLTTSGTVAPAVVVSSPQVGAAGWFALYPAPAFTPLAHALP